MHPWLPNAARGRRSQGSRMRYLIIGLGAVAIAAGASAQNAGSNWAYFEPEDGPMQAGVVNAKGEQLILKCDKPGNKRSEERRVGKEESPRWPRYFKLSGEMYRH